MERSPLPRKAILALIEEERQLILQRYAESEKLASPLPLNNYVRWFTEICKQWAVHHLTELSRSPPGKLLDIGAFFGLIPGVAYRMGWRVSAVDAYPMPAFSSLRVPERQVECALYNACTDVLPFADAAFDTVLLSEVLEHLMYSPLPMFREIRRVLKPSGKLTLSTPNPAGLGKLISLALGGAPLQPTLEQMIDENQTFQHKGLTFLKSNRESKLWTVREIAKTLEMCGLRIQDSYYYGNTIPGEMMSTMARLRTRLMRCVHPLVKRLPFAGGSIFVAARPA
jgi:2-polyprenyl-3-methyl-5-hydroxy-6-metoxy-1,4-benzoquinol methylase